MSSFKVAELVFGFGELRTLAGTVFPAVSSSFCALRNLAGICAFSSFSFCIELRNLIRCLALK